MHELHKQNKRLNYRPRARALSPREREQKVLNWKIISAQQINNKFTGNLGTGPFKDVEVDWQISRWLRGVIDCSKGCLVKNSRSRVVEGSCSNVANWN